MNNLTDDEILEILKASKSQKEAMQKLGYKQNGSGFRYINKICKKLKFDIKQITYRIYKDDYNKSPKKCINCGKTIEWKNRRNEFCSHSCAASYNNLGVSRNKTTNTYYLECQNCGKKYDHKKTNLYCSNKCHNESIYKKYIIDWKNGINSGVRGLYQVSEHIRRYLFDKNNNKCEKCGWSEYNMVTDKIPLEIHHKDGDCTNNKEYNLELLCPNCHSLTDTFGNLNKKSKREYRVKKTLKDINNTNN